MGDMKFRMLLQKLFLVMVSTMLCPKIVYCVHINLGDGSTMAAARVNIICKNFVCFRNRGWGPGKGEEQRRFAMSLWPNEKLLDSALKAFWSLDLLAAIKGIALSSGKHFLNFFWVFRHVLISSLDMFKNHINSYHTDSEQV